MTEGIILTVNKKGALRHTEMYLNHNGFYAGGKTYETTKDFNCCVKTVIKADIINHWQSNECPFWEKKFVWSKMSKQDRLKSYLNRFDEGYGVTFEEL